MCNGGLYNTAECLWDAGDCIYYNTMYPNCHVPNPSLIGDGKCDGDEYSNEQCDWDGGDCPVAEDEDTPDVVATEPNTGSEVLPQGGTPSAPTSDGGNTAKPQEPQKETSVYVQPDTPASTTPNTPASTTPTTPTTDNQEPSSEPNFPTIVTSDATCSLRSDNYYCTADDSCVELEVEECTVYCQDEQACKSAEFADSGVSCYGGSSCYGAEFHRSEESCLKEKDWPCKYSDFLASAVVCENNNGSNSCFYSTFDPCSCCDGPDCPSGIASCSGSGLQAFCSSIHLGKTCKEWGNPACTDISTERNDSTSEVHAIDTSDATCSLRSDHHYCTADDSCVELEVEECTVYCQDEQACKSAEFADSVVSCYGGSSCYGAEFHRSEESCLKEKDWPCKYSDFLASAVVCENNNGSNSCFYSTFDPCSCCDGPDCPSGIASCSGSGLQAFCSSIHLGKTCKEWGNPACTDISTERNDSTSEVHAIDTSDATCSLRSDHHYCTADDSCVELEVEECTVYCQDEQACKSAEFADSVVSCYGGSSCYGAEFHRSEVSCLKEKDWPCKYSDFLASAVVCENNNGSNSCFYSTFDPCSCCDGPDCPSGIASCSGSGLQAFCSSIHLGKTCKEWGNPACNA